MAVSGFLIKNLIHLKHGLTSATKHNHVDLQEKQLRWLLTQAKDTAFGSKYDFTNILKSKGLIKEYQAKVPVFEYNKMNAEWWKRQQVEENITWPGKPTYFALSSGTTGSESKQIPVTEAMLDSIRSVGIKQIESLALFDLEDSFFEKEVLMLGSSTQLQERDGHLEGEITGISTNHLPFWFKNFYRPNAEIASIADWDIKSQLIAEQAPDWDIVALCGIPFWMMRMLKKIIDYHDLESIHDIWPNLKLYSSGGVPFEPYRNTLDQLTAQPLQILDTYLASEGFLACTTRPDTLDMKLALNSHIFFEFIPMDERGFDSDRNLISNPLSLTIDQVEEGIDYAIIISTPAGAWRYMIGDTIQFTSLKNAEIIISGRTKSFLNVVGAQMAEEKMNAALQQLKLEMGIELNEYTVAALRNEEQEYYHQWIVESADDFDEEKAAKRLDEILQSLNKNYSSSRSKVLKTVCLKVIPPQLFYKWLLKKNPQSGQLKVPRVMKEERMKDLLNFIKKSETVNSPQIENAIKY